jgi:hypothetical protein
LVKIVRSTVCDDLGLQDGSRGTYSGKLLVVLLKQ